MEQQTEKGNVPAVSAQASIPVSGPPLSTPAPGTMPYPYMWVPVPCPMPPFQTASPAMPAVQGPVMTPLVSPSSESDTPFREVPASPDTDTTDVVPPSQDEVSPPQSKFRCSCSRVSFRDTDALTHIMSLWTDLPVSSGEMPSVSSFFGTNETAHACCAPLLCTRVTSQQIDYHLDDARQTLQFYYDGRGRSIPPYATVSAKLPLPLDMCAFIERVRW